MLNKKDKLLIFFYKSTINIILAFLIGLCLLLPTAIFNIFAKTQMFWFNAEFFFAFSGFGLLLSLCRSYTFSLSIILLLGLLEFSQFSSLAYFGDYLNPFWIQQMFIEFADVSDAGLASIKKMYFVPLSLILPYGFILFLLHLTKKQRLYFPFAYYLVLAILIFPGVRMKFHSDSKDIFSFFPIISDPSLVNSLNSYYAWINFILISEEENLLENNFKDYLIEKEDSPEKKLNIVLIMGESATPKHMSVYSYTRKTTPRLEEIAEKEALFLARTGISASNATRSTLPAFYTLQYHPLDHKPIKEQKTNLFKLAKEQGFKNFYISAQNINCLNGVNTSYIDYIAAFDHHKKLFKDKKDDAILELMKEIKLSDRNFIVLHQRNSHSPYHANYSHRPEFDIFPKENISKEEYMINTYDNSILYSDWLYGEVFSHFSELKEKSSTKWKTHIFITSDHGQLFGENGLWGHNHLDMENFKVPMIYCGIDTDDKVYNKLAPKSIITHYELGLQIAELFGVRVINPGEKKDSFYANGVAAFGKSGYLEFKLDPERKEISDIIKKR